jgi:hypothetical protein
MRRSLLRRGALSLLVYEVRNTKHELQKGLLEPQDHSLVELY